MTLHEPSLERPGDMQRLFWAHRRVAAEILTLNEPGCVSKGMTWFLTGTRLSPIVRNHTLAQQPTGMRVLMRTIKRYCVMQSVTYSYTSAYATAATIVAPLLALTFLCLFAAGGAALCFKFQAGPRPSVIEFMVIVAGLLIILWMAALNIQQVRYLSALRARYTLDSGGIRIEAEGGNSYVPWADIASAEHLRLFFSLRLRSSLWSRPVVIFLPTDRGGTEDPIGRKELALSLVATGMGQRFRRSFRA